MTKDARTGRIQDMIWSTLSREQQHAIDEMAWALVEGVKTKLPHQPFSIENARGVVIKLLQLLADRGVI